MSKADCEIRIDTSGWYYDHWKQLFYPAGLAKSKWFEYYAQHFDTVEINNTFYHLPKEQTLQRWHEIAPKGFLYAVKANRYITHIKKLKDTSEPLERFFERVGLLKKHDRPNPLSTAAQPAQRPRPARQFYQAAAREKNRRLRIPAPKLVLRRHV